MKHTAYGFAALAATVLCVAALTARAQEGAAKTVTVTASAPKAVAGKPFTLTVSIAVEKPYHIQGNPTKEGYIATTLTVGSTPGVKVGKITYPKAIEEKIAGDTLQVYEGAVAIKAQVTATRAGKINLPVTIRYQACNDRACFPPTNVTATATVVVSGKSAASSH